MLGSTLAENGSLDMCYGNGFTSPWTATVYLRLYLSDPTLGGLEMSGGGYAAVAIANNSTNWPNASGGQKTNGTALVFPTSTGAWSAGSAGTYWGLTDATPNIFDSGPLVAPVIVTIPFFVVQFDPGSLVIQAT
jgi:hypothetical protein